MLIEAGASKANSPISTHYRDYQHLLQVVIDGFGALLSEEDRQTLMARRAEVQRLLDASAGRGPE